MSQLVYTSHSICYLDEVHRKHTAFRLLYIGYKIFAKAYRVYNFEGIKNNIREIEEKGMLNGSVDRTFGEEILLDSVKISICFENYLKAQLLLHGFIIHIIQPIQPVTGELSRLKAEQRTSPIAINEVIRIRDYAYDGALQMYTLPGISDKTLNYSTLLEKENYLNVANIPSGILSLLKIYNNTRNTLHFLGATSDSYDQSFIQRNQMLIDFVNANIKTKSNELAAERNLPLLIFP